MVHYFAIKFKKMKTLLFRSSLIYILIVTIFLFSSFSPNENILLTYACPTGGVTVTKTAQHCSMATDSANIVGKLFLAGVRMYPTVINAGTGISVSGSYANGFTITNTINPIQVNSDWTSGSGVSQILNKPTIPTTTSQLTNNSGFLTSEVDGSITNEIELPSQTSNSGRTLLTNGTSVSWGKRQETYSGTTNASGNYMITFSSSYLVAPNIQANIISGSNTNLIKITSIATTGFTINVVNRADVVGLLPSYTNVNGASVDILITEK